MIYFLFMWCFKTKNEESRGVYLQGYINDISHLLKYEDSAMSYYQLSGNSICIS